MVLFACRTAAIDHINMFLVDTCYSETQLCIFVFVVFTWKQVGSSMDISTLKTHNSDLTTLKKGVFENIVGKAEMLVTSIFCFSHNVPITFCKTFFTFSLI